MKFKDLEEGKDYTSNNIHHESKDFMCYRIKDRILWVVDKREVNNSHASGLTMYEINTTDFIEIPQYVTFEEAIEHMKNGGKCQLMHKAWDDEFYKIDKYNDLVWSEDDNEDEYTDVTFNSDYLEPKWILL